MPTVTEIKDSIEALSGTDQRKFNQACESKIYKIGTGTVTGTIQDLVDDVEALSDFDFAELQGAVSRNRQLSSRPC
jgi:hypothetical protein